MIVVVSGPGGLDHRGSRTSIRNVRWRKPSGIWLVITRAYEADGSARLARWSRSDCVLRRGRRLCQDPHVRGRRFAVARRSGLRRGQPGRLARLVVQPPAAPLPTKSAQSDLSLTPWRCRCIECAERRRPHSAVFRSAGESNGSGRLDHLPDVSDAGGAAGLPVRRTAILRVVQPNRLRSRARDRFSLLLLP